MRIVGGRVNVPTKRAMLSSLEPTGYLKDYEELYRVRDETDFLRDSPRLRGATFHEAALNLFDQPLSEFIGLLDDIGIERVICAAIDVRSAHGRHLPNDVVGEVVAQYPDRIIGLAGFAISPHTRGAGGVAAQAQRARKVAGPERAAALRSRLTAQL